MGEGWSHQSPPNCRWISRVLLDCLQWLHAWGWMGSPKLPQQHQQPDGIGEPWGFTCWSIKSSLWPVCEPAGSGCQPREKWLLEMFSFVLAILPTCNIPLKNTKKGTRHCKHWGKKKKWDIPSSFSVEERGNSQEALWQKNIFCLYSTFTNPGTQSLL